MARSEASPFLVSNSSTNETLCDNTISSSIALMNRRPQLSDHSNLSSPDKRDTLVHNRKRSSTPRHPESSAEVLPLTVLQSPPSSQRNTFFAHATRLFSPGNERCRWNSPTPRQRRPFRRRTLAMGMALLLLLLLVTCLGLLSSQSTSSLLLINTSADEEAVIRLSLLPLSANATRVSLLPVHSMQLPRQSIRSSGRPNYGGIRYAPVVDAMTTLDAGNTLQSQSSSQTLPGRVIMDGDETRYQQSRTKLLDYLDRHAMQAESDQERAMLQDPSRYEHYDEQDWHAIMSSSSNGDSQHCQRPKWSFDTNLNCNVLHEVYLPQLDQANNLQSLAIKYLSEGSFRMAWLLQSKQSVTSDDNNSQQSNGITNTDDTIVMKNLRLALDWNALTMKQVHLEALVMSQTLDSRATADIYGHCGTSILVETGQSIRNSVFYSQSVMDISKVERRQREWGSKSLNRLTEEQRLKLAVSMAESLAVMHGMLVYY
jgi:hypothetical protein